PELAVLDEPSAGLDVESRVGPPLGHDPSAPRDDPADHALVRGGRRARHAHRRARASARRRLPRADLVRLALLHARMTLLVFGRHPAFAVPTLLLPTLF